MTGEEKKLLQAFETRLRHFIYRCNKQEEEKALLQKELDSLHLENEKLKAQCEDLNKRYANMKTAAAIHLRGSDVSEAKQRLSRLVREVDKCIALLMNKEEEHV